MIENLTIEQYEEFKKLTSNDTKYNYRILFKKAAEIYGFDFGDLLSDLATNKSNTDAQDAFLYASNIIKNSFIHCHIENDYSIVNDLLDFKKIKRHLSVPVNQNIFDMNSHTRSMMSRFMQFNLSKNDKYLKNTGSNIPFDRLNFINPTFDAFYEDLFEYLKNNGYEFANMAGVQNRLVDEGFYYVCGFKVKLFIETSKELHNCNSFKKFLENVRYSADCKIKQHDRWNKEILEIDLYFAVHESYMEMINNEFYKKLFHFYKSMHELLLQEQEESSRFEVLIQDIRKDILSILQESYSMSIVSTTIESGSDAINAKFNNLLDLLSQFDADQEKDLEKIKRKIK